MYNMGNKLFSEPIGIGVLKKSTTADRLFRLIWDSKVLCCVQRIKNWSEN